MSKIISNTSEDNLKLLFKDYALAENLRPEKLKYWIWKFCNWFNFKNTLFIDLVFKQKEIRQLILLSKTFQLLLQRIQKYNDEAIKEKKNQFTNEFIESIKTNFV